jgi:predicted nucleotidyltransferase
MITAKDTISNISASRRQRFKKAQMVLRRLKSILVEKYDVNRIILIGSFAEPDRFEFHSDIDLCVEGLLDSLYFKAVGELLLEADDFDVDIIPIEDVTSEMKKNILRGKVIYEKR